jgi:hypothetical protein
MRIRWIASALSIAALAAVHQPLAAQRPKLAELTLSTVIDSVRLDSALRALPGLPSRGWSLYYLRYDSTGALEEVEPLTRRETAADSAVVGVLKALAAPRQPDGYDDYLLMRAAWGATPVLRTHHAVHEEQPRLQNLVWMQRDLGQMASRYSDFIRPQGEKLEIKLRVDQDGTPSEIALTRLTGLADLDRDVLRMASRLRFRPCTVEGIPLKCWVMLPINIVLGAPTPQPGPAVGYRRPNP